MGRSAKPGIYDNRNAGLFDDDRDLVPGPNAAVCANGSSQRHDRCGSGLLQAFSKDWIGIDVRKHRESFLYQDLGRLEGFYRIRHQVVRIRRHFKLDPRIAPGSTCEASQSDSFLGIPRAAGIRQQQVPAAIDVR